MSKSVRPVTKPLSGRNIPLLFGNENLEHGESELHTLTGSILYTCIKSHLARQRNYHVFWDLNVEYDATHPERFVSPDVMVVEWRKRRSKNFWNYRIGHDGPAPRLVVEVLSYRMWQQADLTTKPKIYAAAGIPELILVDVSGEYLPQRLLLKRLQPDGTWRDEQDADGGITSQFGFRVIIYNDGQVRVVDAETGRQYVTPDEAEDRIQALEAELARLRGDSPKIPRHPRTPRL